MDTRYEGGSLDISSVSREKEVKEVLLDPENPETKVLIGTNISEDIEEKLISFLKSRISTFAWKYEDMRVISSDIITHKIPAYPNGAFGPRRYNLHDADRDILLHSNAIWPKECWSHVSKACQHDVQRLAGGHYGGRMAKWSVKLSTYDLIYEPRAAIKSQALADFLADFSSDIQPEVDLEVKILDEDTDHFDYQMISRPENFPPDGKFDPARRLGDIHTIDEIRNIAKIRMASYQQKIHKSYNKNIRIRRFQIGDLVLRKAFQNTTNPSYGKLAPKWEGPYRIESEAGKGHTSIAGEDTRLYVSAQVLTRNQNLIKT
ncbi:hypothetical protein E3N88_40403 [Mikania micrantha]|uniref:Reverse transcriptase domain-containing protein n=1 Tax=Mikania micrantha TaxID=192012 RepID=A0A5N6LMK3_9ASTR|nr:hypothetical protein E3N88_40403 [Mikania micrantha]